jgi:hypothetical protein
LGGSHVASLIFEEFVWFFGVVLGEGLIIDETAKTRFGLSSSYSPRPSHFARHSTAIGTVYVLRESVQQLDLLACASAKGTPAFEVGETKWMNFGGPFCFVSGFWSQLLAQQLYTCSPASQNDPMTTACQ